MTMLRFPRFFCGLAVMLVVLGASTRGASGYRLFVRDVIRISVQGEPDVSVDRRVDGAGEVNVPLLGSLKVSGLTPTEVQALIAKRYVAEEIFNRPEVVVSMVDYSPKEVMVLGQVSKQGKQALPHEAMELPLVEAITSAGGLTRLANGGAVRVTRKDDKGGEESFSVDVDKMIQGRATGSGQSFMLQPGDVVFVPERVF